MGKHKILLGVLLLVGSSAFSQQQINLAAELENEKITAVGRTISTFAGHPEAVEMNAENSDGLGILAEIEFTQGRIEVELLGENNPGKSFIGIAFNIQDDKTYEAIYFRPFNFVAEEQTRKDHMAQYIFHPEFTWRKLREERTGEFEAEITSPPNPDKWFKAVIIIQEKKVEVYVNEIAEPVLTINRLTTAKSNKIGVWTGYGSSGRFRNLILRSE